MSHDTYNLQDIVQQCFANDIMMSFFNSIYDLRSLAITSTIFHKYFMKKDAFKKIILKNVHLVAIDYGFLDITTFNNFLISKSLVVSGSCALRFLGHKNLNYLENNDMDLFTKNCTYDQFANCQAMVNQNVPNGYMVSFNQSATYYYNWDKICFDLIKRTREKTRKIQIIVSLDQFENPTRDFDLNLVKNVYDPANGGRFISYFPSDVINCSTIMDYKIIDSYLLSLTTKQWNNQNEQDRISRFIEKRQSRFKKYRERGYELKGEEPMIYFKKALRDRLNVLYNRQSRCCIV